MCVCVCVSFQFCLFNQNASEMSLLKTQESLWNVERVTEGWLSQWITILSSSHINFKSFSVTLDQSTKLQVTITMHRNDPGLQNLHFNNLYNWFNLRVVVMFVFLKLKLFGCVVAISALCGGYTRPMFIANIIFRKCDSCSWSCKLLAHSCLPFKIRISNAVSRWNIASSSCTRINTATIKQKTLI